MTIQDLYNKLEKELYTCKLTEEEKQNKIEEVARAIENEREVIKHLEEGLTNTLTNDAYFKDEIKCFRGFCFTDSKIIKDIKI